MSIELTTEELIDILVGYTTGYNHEIASRLQYLMAENVKLQEEHKFQEDAHKTTLKVNRKHNAAIVALQEHLNTQHKIIKTAFADVDEMGAILAQIGPADNESMDLLQELGLKILELHAKLV